MKIVFVDAINENVLHKAFQNLLKLEKLHQETYDHDELFGFLSDAWLVFDKNFGMEDWFNQFCGIVGYADKVNTPYIELVVYVFQHETVDSSYYCFFGSSSIKKQALNRIREAAAKLAKLIISPDMDHYNQQMLGR